MHNICVISLVVLTMTLDIVLLEFLEISYHIASMTCKVTELYGGDHLTNLLVYESEHITKKSRLGVIKDYISPLGLLDQKCREIPQIEKT